MKPRVQDAFVGLRVPTALKGHLEQLAEGQGVTISEWIRETISRHATHGLRLSEDTGDDPHAA